MSKYILGLTCVLGALLGWSNVSSAYWEPYLGENSRSSSCYVSINGIPFPGGTGFVFHVPSGTGISGAIEGDCLPSEYNNFLGWDLSERDTITGETSQSRVAQTLVSIAASSQKARGGYAWFGGGAGGFSVIGHELPNPVITKKTPSCFVGNEFTVSSEASTDNYPAGILPEYKLSYGRSWRVIWPDGTAHYPWNNGELEFSLNPSDPGTYQIELTYGLGLSYPLSLPPVQSVVTISVDCKSVEIKNAEFYQAVQDPTLGSFSEPGIDIALGKAIGIKAEVKSTSGEAIKDYPAHVALVVDGNFAGAVDTISDENGILSPVFDSQNISLIHEGYNDLRFEIGVKNSTPALIFTKRVNARRKNENLNFVVLKEADANADSFEQFALEYQRYLRAVLPIASERVQITKGTFDAEWDKWMLTGLGTELDSGNRLLGVDLVGQKFALDQGLCNVENTIAYLPASNDTSTRGSSSYGVFGTSVEESPFGSGGTKHEAVVAAYHYGNSIGVSPDSDPVDTLKGLIPGDSGSAGVFRDDLFSFMNPKVNLKDITLFPEDAWISNNSNTSFFVKFRLPGLGSPTTPNSRIYKVLVLVNLKKGLRAVAFKAVSTALRCVTDQFIADSPWVLKFLTKQLGTLGSIKMKPPVINKQGGADLVAAASGSFEDNGDVPLYVQVEKDGVPQYRDSFQALWMQSIVDRIPDSDIIGSVSIFNAQATAIIEKVRRAVNNQDFQAASSAVTGEFTMFLQAKVKASRAPHSALTLDKDEVLRGANDVYQGLLKLSNESPLPLLALRSGSNSYRLNDSADLYAEVLRPNLNPELEAVISSKLNGVMQRQLEVKQNIGHLVTERISVPGNFTWEAQLMFRNKREAATVKATLADLRKQMSDLEHEIAQEQDPARRNRLISEKQKVVSNVNFLEEKLVALARPAGAWHTLTFTVE